MISRRTHMQNLCLDNTWAIVPFRSVWCSSCWPRGLPL